eukprot:5538636-Pyramimonas_sp.AAC.1
MGPSRRPRGRSWGPLGPSSAVGMPRRSNCPNPSRTERKPTMLASSGPPGGPLGVLLGRVG